MIRRAEGNLELRPMASNDVSMALRIIQDYDEDVWELPQKQVSIIVHKWTVR